MNATKLHTVKSDRAIIAKGNPDPGCNYAPETRDATCAYYAALNREYNRQQNAAGIDPSRREDFHSDG